MISELAAERRQVRLREFLLGIEGLALLRRLFDGDDSSAQARVEEVRRILAPESDDAFGQPTDYVEVGVADLYRAWAATYDESSKPVRAAEEPVVRALLAGLPPGRALDVACGTGRHARWLAEHGHDVTGVDVSPEMLERARALVPGARFVAGDLCDLPVATASADLVVCGMALDHLPDLRAPLAEVARVLRPGGSAVVSDVHPVISALGGAAHVGLPGGMRGFVRNHGHLHGDYLDAFAAAGLDVRRCVEPRYTAELLALKKTAMKCVPEATTQAYLGLPAALVWHLVRR